MAFFEKFTALFRSSSIRKVGNVAYKAGQQGWRWFDLQRWENKLNTLVSLLLRIGALLLIVALGVLLYRIFHYDGYTIESFNVPENLTKNGYEGTVVARLIQDEYLMIKQEAASIKTDSVKTSGGDEQPELNVAVMGLGISLRSIGFHLRELLGRHNNIIRGEITYADSLYSLTLRMTGFAPQTFSTAASQGHRQAILQLIHKAGEAVLGKTDPYRLAIYYDRKRQFEEGKAVVRRMLTERPTERHWAFVAWGALLEDQGYFEEALAKFQAASDAKSDFALPWMRQAWCLQRQGKMEASLPKIEKALTLAPSEPSYWTSYGFTLMALKRNKEADQAFTHLMELVPDQWEWAINWAEGKMKGGDMEGAKKITHQVIEKSKTDLGKALARTYLAYLEHDSVSLVKHSLEAIDLDPNNGFAVQAAVHALLHAKAYDKAIAIVTGVQPTSQNAPQMQAIYNSTAMAYNALGRHDSAFAFVQRSIAINPSAAYPYSTLAESYAFVGEVDRFYETLEKAFQMGFLTQMITPADEPYSRFVKDPRYIALIHKYSTPRVVNNN